MSTDYSSSPASSSDRSLSQRIAIAPGAEDGDEYSNGELQFIYDTVIRAETVLPTLPRTSRLPTNALFRAFGQLCDERDCDPVNGTKLDKLLFKIGGSSDGKTITEKFQAVMARMNITVRLDDEEVSDEASDRSFSHHSNQSTHTFDSLLDAIPQGVLKDSPPPLYSVPHRVTQQLVQPISRNQDNVDDDPEDATKEAHLQKTAAAYQKHRAKISSMNALHEWQEKSNAFKTRTDLFEEAREEDLKEAAHNVVVAWAEIANEVDEMPLDELPSNVYSKRIEKIATRTDEIKTTKKAIDSWGQRAISQEEEDDLFKEDPRLARVAQTTHEIVSKSRAVIQWANRAEEKREKARLAEIAHEMMLKRKVFGLGTPNMANLRAVLNKRQETVGRSQPAAAQPSPTTQQLPVATELPSQVDERLQKPSATPLAAIEPSVVDTDSALPAAQQSLAPTSRPAEQSQATAKQPPGVTSLPMKTTLPPSAPKSRREKLLDELDNEPDERTLLARRHLMRRKFFHAWEGFTEEYTSKVKAAVTSRALDPWRQRAADIDSTAKHDDSTTKDRRRLARWHHSDRHQKLEEKASQFHKKTHVNNSLNGWRTTAREAKDREQRMNHMAERCNEYRSKHGTLRTWKARSRETAVQGAMKEEALETWRDECGEDKARNEELKYIAHRVNLYRVKMKTIPLWYEAMGKAAAKQAQFEIYAERAAFYTCATQALSVWRAAAAKKKKARLKQAYVENRCRVKKNAGARAVDQWHAISDIRHGHLDNTTKEFTAQRDWTATANAWELWRLRTNEHTEAEAARQAAAERNKLTEWRAQAEGRRQVPEEADELFEAKALSARIKQWKLGSLQLESCRNASIKHLARERKVMKVGLETWAAKAKDKVKAVPETPGRPRLLFGIQSTTPLAPPPRQFGRSRRNLRVSWAE